jgi:hypothetical protein
MVMNHDDSAFNRHPNPAKGCAESVNWNLKGAHFYNIFTIPLRFFYDCDCGATYTLRSLQERGRLALIIPRDALTLSQCAGAGSYTMLHGRT